jgi:sugar phosphate isomerase/epimerase
MFNQIGIMQGRLLPKLNGRYQAHPLGYWQNEFYLAQKFGLSCIEFILDYNDFEQNPLMSEVGLKELTKVIQATGVGVKSVCADYFMEAPLHVESMEESQKSQDVLLRLLKNAVTLGITDIVIPCVDQSSLKQELDQDRLVQQLQRPIALATEHKINLALETDLSPSAFAKLLAKFDADCVTVNYDLGNSAALGFDISEEFETYGHKISDIHIKDRTLGGGSVVLGNGNADFNKFFKLLGEMDFKGPIVMQVFRDDEGVQIFKEQLNWFRKKYAVYKNTWS